MTKFNALKDHPDCEEITQKLMEGAEPRAVADWLKIRYPEKAQKHLCLSIKLLKEFQNSGYEQVYLQVNRGLEAAAEGQELDPQLAKSLVNNKTFQERVHEVLQNEIDLDQTFKEIRVGLTVRMEQVFDKIQQNPEGFKGDYVLLKYFEQLMNFVDKYDKFKNNRPDMIIQHNHTVAYVDHYTSALQSAILETLQEIDPEVALICQEKISDKIAHLKVGLAPEAPQAHQLLAEGRYLDGQFAEITS